MEGTVVDQGCYTTPSHSKEDANSNVTRGMCAFFRRPAGSRRRPTKSVTYRQELYS